MTDSSEDLAGKTLFRVTFARTEFCDVYVYAVDRNGAIEDAEELVGTEPSSAWYDEDLEVDHVQSDVKLPVGKSAWSGGPDGHEVSHE